MKKSSNRIVSTEVIVANVISYAKGRGAANHIKKKLECNEMIKI